jgi:SHAQKYF class myb-like DNA-binding protein
MNLIQILIKKEQLKIHQYQKKKRRQEEEVTKSTESIISEETKKTESTHRAINNPLGTYSPEEEKRFLEGIELYGRDWKNLTKYVGTRNSKSVRSHAQKHFIKLYREAKPLPPKVRESGLGYTLSGKPLDPYSASAKPYLANVDIDEIERKIALFNGNKSNDSEETSDKNSSKPKEKEHKSNINKNNRNNNNNNNKTELKNNDNIKSTNKNLQNKTNSLTPNKDINIKKETNNKKSNTCKRSKSQQALLDSIQFDEDGRTLYSKQRPKRSTATKNLNYKEFIDTSNPLTMVKCESYYGVPGSGTPGSQPFSIIVNPVALATMDLHAHLVKTEVIGLLAGEWNMEEKKLYVISAYPCKSIENDDNTEESMNRHVNVEMDPIGEFEIRNEITKLNMKVVGWYHSHPKFAPDPSFVDIENQLNYQTLFREKNNIDEPFVGVIVGPYDPRLPRSYSAVNWFYVANHQEDFGHPKHLITKTEWLNKNKNNIPVKEYEKMKTLINNYKDHIERHVFTETWKQNLEETKLEKVIKSLSYQLQLLNSGNLVDTEEELQINKNNDNFTIDIISINNKIQNDINSDVDDVNYIDDNNDNDIDKSSDTSSILTFTSSSELSDVSGLSTNSENMSQSIIIDDDEEIKFEDNEEHQQNVIEENNMMDKNDKKIEVVKIKIPKEKEEINEKKDSDNEDKEFSDTNKQEKVDITDKKKIINDMNDKDKQKEADKKEIINNVNKEDKPEETDTKENINDINKEDKPEEADKKKNINEINKEDKSEEANKKENINDINKEDKQEEIDKKEIIEKADVPDKMDIINESKDDERKITTNENGMEEKDKTKESNKIDEKNKSNEKEKEDKKNEEKELAETDSMDLEDKIENQKPSEINDEMEVEDDKPSEKETVDFYDGINLLKMIEEEIKKWYYDDVKVIS